VRSRSVWLGLGLLLVLVLGAACSDQAPATPDQRLVADLGRADQPSTSPDGRATEGEIVFTADGTLGLVALEDGSVGVFRLDASGSPTVVHASFKAKQPRRRGHGDPGCAGDPAVGLPGPSGLRTS